LTLHACRSAGDRSVPDKVYSLEGELLDTAEAKAYRYLKIIIVIYTIII
jgi:hypothetical protein